MTSAAGWTMAHQTYDAGYPKQPRSGCAGTFRVSTDDDGHGPAWLECDGCSAVVTVPRATLTDTPPARPTEQLATDGGSGSWPF